MNQNSFQTLQDYLVTTNVQIPVLSFAINLLLAAALSFALGRIYIRYADSLSNRNYFARNFLIIAMTTMLIITIVKASLALSLGLVGALSIVRFRAAIKEPEELGYLFLSIAIGLGLGANQGIITAVAFILIVTILIIRKKVSKKSINSQNLYLTIYSHNPEKIELRQVIDTVKNNCATVNLKRFDETKESLEVSFFVEFSDVEQLNKTKDELYKANEDVKISFVDNKGFI